MGVDPKRDDGGEQPIAGRATEVRDLLAQGTLKRALQRLQDLALDFGDRQSRNESVVLHARFNQLSVERRRGVERDYERRHNEIVFSALELADTICDCWRAANLAAPAPSRAQLQLTRREAARM